MPSDVYSDDCPFFHPEDKIIDHLQNGHEVTIELCNKLCTDSYGEPILSKWAFIAFKLGDRNREKRESELLPSFNMPLSITKTHTNGSEYIKEKNIEIMENRLRREAEMLRKKLEKTRPQIMKMRAILSEQLCDKKVVEEIMKNEWKVILSSGSLDDVLSDVSSKEQDDIYTFFMEHFIELSDMYKFFSAVNSGGGTGETSYFNAN